eukprot:420129-Rhodomonas_salina.1
MHTLAGTLVPGTVAPGLAAAGSGPSWGRTRRGVPAYQGTPGRLTGGPGVPGYPGTPVAELGLGGHSELSFLRTTAFVRVCHGHSVSATTSS